MRSEFYATLPLLLILVFGGADFQQASPTAEQFRKCLAEQRPVTLKYWQKKLADQEQLVRHYKAGTINRKLSEDVSIAGKGGAVKFKTKEIKLQRIEAATAKAALAKKAIADLEEETPSLPPVLLGGIRIGQVGTLDNGGGSNPPWVRVVQIVDKDKALVKVRTDIPDSQFFSEELVWLQGVSTTGMLDDKTFDLDPKSVYIVAGTKQYETTDGGTKTILLMQQCSEEWRRFVEGFEPTKLSTPTVAPVTAPTKAAASVLYLADVKETAADVLVYGGKALLGKGEIEDGGSKKTISLGGQKLPKGIFAHPKSNGKSRVTYDVKGRAYQFFEASVGVDDAKNTAGDPAKSYQFGPLTFEVWGDGKMLWQSRPVTPGSEPQKCRVAFPQVSQLELIVQCPGSDGSAWAVWGDPRLVSGE